MKIRIRWKRLETEIATGRAGVRPGRKRNGYPKFIENAKDEQQQVNAVQDLLNLLSLPSHMAFLAHFLVETSG